MFYGNAQSITAFLRNLFEILMGFHRTNFIKKSSLNNFDKIKYVFDQSIWECYGHFDYWFSNNTKAFLCGIWNLLKEKVYPLGSSDLVLHSSINQCVVNGRDAITAHS